MTQVSVEVIEESGVEVTVLDAPGAQVTVGAGLGDETPLQLGAASAGTAATAARVDHVHAHGNQSGGNLHALATTDAAGFMSAGQFDLVNGATALGTASAVVRRDASGNFVANQISAELIGNASTATALATARTINGVSFNGTANITITAEPAAGSVDNDSVSASAAIALSKLAAVTAGRVVMGNASNVAAAIEVSGDATLSNAGVLTIADESITNAKVSATAAIDGGKIDPNFAGQNIITSGSVTGGSFTPTSNSAPENGFYLPAANAIAIATDSAERLRVTASGMVLVGNPTTRTNFSGSVGHRMVVEGVSIAERRIAVISSGAEVGGGQVTLAHQRSGAVGGNTILQDNDALGVVGFSGSDGVNFVTGAVVQAQVDGTPAEGSMPARLMFSTTPSGSASAVERMRITQSGDVLIANPTPRTNFASLVGHRMAIEGVGTAERRIAVISSAADINGAQLTLAHQRSGTIGGNTTLQSGDSVGVVMFAGSEGSSFINCASIRAQVDDTPDNNKVPGRLIFATSFSSLPLERMRITHTGNVLIGNTTGTERLSVTGKVQLTATGDSYMVGSNDVVGSRKTGWTAATGTADRTTFETSTVTIENLAQRVKALIDDLTLHGLIGA
jgi:hypothetical protein